MLGCTAALYSAPAAAEFSIQQSRYVVHHSEREATVFLKNTGDYPIIIQNWVDDGVVSNVPQQAVAAPLMTLPPLLHLEPQQIKPIRLINKFSQEHNQQAESLYWLNLYELVPSNPQAQAGDVLKVNVRLQMKLFYRPDKWQLDTAKLSRQLRFHCDEAEQRLRIDNPSPFYASFGEIMVAKEPQLQTTLTIAPSSSVSVPLYKRPVNKTPLQFSLIDDDGNVQVFNTQIQIQSKVMPEDE
ncbi:molecular chaperone [Vitreoscilla massiliensis]|uniref:Molecular chaperone n=1 Tax=Vitreoscilla massiliensis TaxID=1689272 RepID=A0ABY4E134_9NEIS|nr:molecular chaperone [Vitreoscilla massiliensis]UOO89061.1 molecular chaperone [Vitreoscilla massiliensis]